MIHLSMWRERLRNAFSDVSQGRDFVHPSENVDELNDSELPDGIGTPLADAASRADVLLGELIDLYERLGERAFLWYGLANTSEVVLRNSYTHPRVHMSEYWKENGRLDRAAQVWEAASAELESVAVPPRFLPVSRYNLAGLRVSQGRRDDAIALLGAALATSETLRKAARDDPDLAPLREDPRFQELVKS